MPLGLGCLGPVCALFFTNWKVNNPVFLEMSANIHIDFSPNLEELKENRCFTFQYVKNNAQTCPERFQGIGVSCSLVLLTLSYK